jgi:transposase InsO family protein
MFTGDIAHTDRMLSMMWYSRSNETMASFHPVHGKPTTLEIAVYLAVVMDLYSRRIVGWSMDRWMSRHLVLDALSMALGGRNPEGQLIHHSDRGAQ